MTDELIESWCLSTNDNVMNCATRACISETKFLSDVTKWKNDGGVAGTTVFSASTGNFDPVSGCLTTSSSVGASTTEQKPTQYNFGSPFGRSSC